MNMTDSHDIDPLFEIKNNFFLGNYQQCINDSQKLKTSDSQLSVQRDVFLYRAYIGQRKYAVVLDAISPASASELKAVRLLADYLASPADKRQRIVAGLAEKMGANVSENDHVTLLMAATVFLYENDSDSALRLLHQSENVECLALSVQALLSIDRPDAARKELARMQSVDEDSTLTQLATAQVGLHSGGEKLQDAFYAYQELLDKYGGTSSLLNGKAAALMCMGRWEEAEPVMQEALDKDCNHPDTLVNMTVLSQHLGKEAEVCGRYVSQLKDSYRAHPWVVDYAAKEIEFDQFCANYRESVPS